MGKSNSRSKIVSGRYIFAVLIAVFAIAGGIAAYNLITTERNYSTARNEYNELRMYVQTHAITSSGEENNETTAEADMPMQHETKPDLSEINPDYIGWIQIDGTNVDYPIVQGADNYKYLNTTFMGERNPSGAIFMDSRNTGGFFGFSLIHGHNMRDGSMFGDLYKLLDIELDDELQPVFPEITIFTPENKSLTYQIFAVRRTTENDTVFMLPESGYDEISEYFAEFGFSPDYLQQSIDILVLATCTTGGRSERLLVMATRNRI